MGDSGKSSIEFKEEVVNATLARAEAAYDLACERIYKLLPVLVGAASALAVFGLGVINTRPTAGAPLVAASIWLCAVASYAVLKGAKSNELMAGTDSGAIEDQLSDFRRRLNCDDVELEALRLAREGQILAVDKQITSYTSLASKRSQVLDHSYKALVIGTPFAIFLGYLAAVRWPAIS